MIFPECSAALFNVVISEDSVETLAKGEQALSITPEKAVRDTKFLLKRKIHLNSPNKKNCFHLQKDQPNSIYKDY